MQRLHCCLASISKLHRSLVEQFANCLLSTLSNLAYNYQLTKFTVRFQNCTNFQNIIPVLLVHNHGSTGIQPNNLVLTPSNFSIMISWTAPQFSIPDYYSVSIACSRLCDNITTTSGMQVVPGVGATTSYTVTGLNPGNGCDLRVIAAVGSVSRQSDVATTSTLTAGMNIESHYCIYSPSLSL